MLWLFTRLDEHLLTLRSAESKTQSYIGKKSIITLNAFRVNCIFCLKKIIMTNFIYVRRWMLKLDFFLEQKPSHAKYYDKHLNSLAKDVCPMPTFLAKLLELVCRLTSLTCGGHRWYWCTSNPIYIREDSILFERLVHVEFGSCLGCTSIAWTLNSITDTVENEVKMNLW